jgi:hypothetical protein
LRASRADLFRSLREIGLAINIATETLPAITQIT